MMKELLKYAFIVMFAFSVTSSTKAQENYDIHTVYIYSFIKYVEWPTGTREGDFIIGVLGESPIVRALKKMAKLKKAGTQKIVIKEFNDPVEMTTCHVLFLSNSNQDKFEGVIEKLKNRPTLLITESKGLAKKGSCINFVRKGNNLAFELNRTSVDRANLKVAGELVKLAVLI